MMTDMKKLIVFLTIVMTAKKVPAKIVDLQFDEIFMINRF